VIFRHYNVSELCLCANEFAQHFANSPPNMETSHILRWFASTAPPDIRVYGKYADKEYLLDQCHTTFPKPIGSEPWQKRWVRALQQPLEFRLALESEWGAKNSHSENLARVLDDAWKLALIKANVKVMVFATTSSKKAQSILDCLDKLRSRSGDIAPWLCIDIPWNQKDTTHRAVVHRVL
jgi:hypothetical protein